MNSVLVVVVQHTSSPLLICESYMHDAHAGLGNSCLPVEIVWGYLDSFEVLPIEIKGGSWKYKCYKALNC